MALAVVGTGMVVLTSLSLRTIKQARRNEIQDVSIQAGVEAMDFLKQPTDINVGVDPGGSNLPDDEPGTYYKLDFGSSQGTPILQKTDEIPPNGEIVTCSGDPEDAKYRISSLEESGYNICRQVKVTKNTLEEYEIEVIVTWETIGGEVEVKKFKGLRLGKFVESE